MCGRRTDETGTGSEEGTGLDTITKVTLIAGGMSQ